MTYTGIKISEKKLILTESMQVLLIVLVLVTVINTLIRTYDCSTTCYLSTLVRY